MFSYFCKKAYIVATRKKHVTEVLLISTHNVCSHAVIWYSWHVSKPYWNYLTKLTKKHYSALLKFRLSNHRLPVETGRWENTPLDERKCVLCEKNDIGDEFHYLFVCNHFKSERKNFLMPYFYKRPNIIKFKELLSTENENLLMKLSCFIKIIMKKFSNAS